MYSLLLFLVSLPYLLIGPGWALKITPQACDMCVTDARGASLFLRPWHDEGATGILAHNYLSGERFYSLAPGDRLATIYPDRHVERYEVVEVRRYYDYVGFDEWAVYYDVYRPGWLTLQTCIGKDNGFLFVIAAPVGEQ